jgi:NAD+ diphosphatase
VLNSGVKASMSKDEVARIDGKEGATGKPRSRSNSDPQAALEFRMPPATAIAHTLVEAWANGTAFTAQGKL